MAFQLAVAGPQNLELDFISSKHHHPHSPLFVPGHHEEATSWCLGDWDIIICWWDIIICQSSFSKIKRDSNDCRDPCFQLSAKACVRVGKLLRVLRVRVRERKLSQEAYLHASARGRCLIHGPLSFHSQYLDLGSPHLLVSPCQLPLTSFFVAWLSS